MNKIKNIYPLAKIAKLQLKLLAAIVLVAVISFSSCKPSYYIPSKKVVKLLEEISSGFVTPIWDEYEYFSCEEFSQKGHPDSCYEMDGEFIRKLEIARIISGIPFKVNSGFRFGKHNEKVRGVKDSSHTKGLAADIHARSSHEKYLIVRGAMAADIHRIGIYRTHIHLDEDYSKPKEVLWQDCK